MQPTTPTTTDSSAHKRTHSPSEPFVHVDVVRVEPKPAGSGEEPGPLKEILEVEEEEYGCLR